MFAQLWQRLRLGENQVRQQPDWSLFAGTDWVERIMSIPVTDRLFTKQGRSIGRLCLHANNETLVVYLKRHYRLPRRLGLFAWLFPRCSWSPAFEEWDNLERLRNEGFATPRAVAAGQFLLPGGHLQSVLVVEELTGMLALHEAIPLAQRSLDARTFAQWKRGLTAALATVCRRLHDRSFFHKDLYLCHFFIPEADCRRVPPTWDDRMVMIDLHRLGRHRFTGLWWLGKDLGQLLYSSDVEGITPRDRLRFWQLYRGKKSGWLTRFVALLARTRASNYHALNQRKPQVPMRAA